MSSTELIIPESDGLVQSHVVESFELDVRQRIRDIDDLAVLIPAVERVNRLAKMLAGTKIEPPAMAAARRVEWQIGRVLGPPPGAGEHNKTESLASDTGMSADDAHKFRLVGTLDLEWDALEPWAKSRARLVKVAKERRREPSEAEPDIRKGDFRTVLAHLEPSSVSLFLTDPPYAQDALSEYSALAAFAADKLVDGGSLICYVGQSTLPGAITALSEHLRYWWCLALDHRGGGQQLPGKWVRIKWKPILWFTKGPRRDRTYVHDVIRGIPPSKALHEWAQGVDEVLPLIESLTDPNELVCDPFAGSGSFGVAALKLGRQFIGADDRE